jgi:mersacidin/lichenicidin family type 2 lantibiotic
VGCLLPPRPVLIQGGYFKIALTLFLVTQVMEIPMLSEKIIRAWKDVEYRLSLSEAERALLPDHPAGLVELTEKELQPVEGGTGVFTLRCHTYPLSLCCPHAV